MALVSPGVQVTVTDESFFSSAGPGTVPLILIATKQDKLTPDGTGIAAGTTAANADSLYLMGSQRELLQTFGDPDFNEIGGTAQNGYPLNEYGLLAAYSFLGAANRAYVARADVDLDGLSPTSVAPTGASPNDTYWLDTATTVDGLFRWTASGAWAAVPNVTVITSSDIPNGGDPEPSSGYQNGDYVVNYKSDGNVSYFQRLAGAWALLGSAAHRAGNDFQWAPHAAEPTLQSDGTTSLAIDDVWLKTSTPNNGLDLSLSHYDSSLGQFVTDTVANFENSHANYYGLPGVTASSVVAGTVVGFIPQSAAYIAEGGLFDSPSELSRPLHPQRGVGDGTGSEATFSLEMHNGESTVVLTGTTPVSLPTTDAISTFELNSTNTTPNPTGDLDGATTIDLLVILTASNVWLFCRQPTWPINR